MKHRKALISILIILVVSLNGKGQVIKFGGGYFGETISHPGLAGEIERERRFSEQVGLSLRLDAGFYHHTGNANVVFTDISYGFRRYFKNGLFLEQYLGAGVMAFFYDEDVWHIDESGNAVQVSRFGNYNFMPSVSSGMGYVFSRNTELPKLLWLRPKLFWQFPFNNRALPHLALQAGLTFTLSRHEKKK